MYQVMKHLAFFLENLKIRQDHCWAVFIQILRIYLGREIMKRDAQIQMQIDDMMETGLLRGFPLAYISGMSIKNSFIICDEAQNIGRSLIRDIVTRCGQGSKLVVLGDTNQIDVPFLDKTNSGLGISCA